MRPPLSSVEPPVTGKYGFCYFSDRFLRRTCVYVYIMLLVFFVCVCFDEYRPEEELERMNSMFVALEIFIIMYSIFADFHSSCNNFFPWKSSCI